MNYTTSSMASNLKLPGYVQLSEIDKRILDYLLGILTGPAPERETVEQMISRRLASMELNDVSNNS